VTGGGLNRDPAKSVLKKNDDQWSGGARALITSGGGGRKEAPFQDDP